MLPQWFWCVRFRTINGSGETLVVAPHRASAKRSIGTPSEDITAYESTEPYVRVSKSVVTQRFGGYYPHVRAALNAGREAIDKLRGN